MPVILSAPGTVEPLANVAVKTRVDGQIIEVLFREGDLVNEGDVLFRLDDRMVKAQIAQAEANIAKDQASLRDAEATLARRKALIDKKVVTEAALDQARFAVEGLKASIAAGQALLDIAEDAARLPHHPRADHGPHRQPQRQGRRHGARRRMPLRAGDHQPDEADLGDASPCRRASSPPCGARSPPRPWPRSAFPAAPSRRSCRARSASSTTRSTSRQAPSSVKVIAENADEVLWPGLVGGGRAHGRGQARMLSVPATRRAAGAAGHDHLGDRRPTTRWRRAW